MPSVSERQRRFFFATKGPAWTKAHHFDQLAPGPKRKRKKRATSGEVSAIVRRLKAM